MRNTNNGFNKRSIQIHAVHEDLFEQFHVLGLSRLVLSSGQLDFLGEQLAIERKIKSDNSRLGSARWYLFGTLRFVDVFLVDCILLVLWILDCFLLLSFGSVLLLLFEYKLSELLWIGLGFKGDKSKTVLGAMEF